MVWLLCGPCHMSTLAQAISFGIHLQKDPMYKRLSFSTTQLSNDKKCTEAQRHAEMTRITAEHWVCAFTQSPDYLHVLLQVSRLIRFMLVASQIKAESQVSSSSTKLCCVFTAVMCGTNVLLISCFMAFSSEDYLMITQMPCINGSVCLVCIRLPCSATACPLNVLLLCTGQQWGRLHLVQVKSLADELVGMYSWRVHGNGMQQCMFGIGVISVSLT